MTQERNSFLSHAQSGKRLMRRNGLPKARGLVFAATLAAMLPVHPPPAFAQAAITKPTDGKITRAVERRLDLSQIVPSHWIDVTTDSGIVTLTGKVDNLLARGRAADLALSTKGVRAVVNRILVATSPRPDEQIREDVIHTLAVEPVTDAYKIAAISENGVVTLRGTVNSWVEKDLAEKVVAGIKGVRRIKNDIVLKYQSDREDAEIAADVRASLKWDPRVADRMIKVDAEKGKVTLSGTVGSATEKNLAYADAWVAGVKFVDNSDLKVEWWARNKMRREQNCVEQSNEDLRLAVMNAFIRDPRVSYFKPTIEVENYVVTLTGVVDNLEAKRAAQMDAKNTACISRVKNQLKVRPFQIFSDDTIANEVRSALARDPHVDRADIRVAVTNGKVSLSGKVDTFYDVVQAEDLATRINGVVDVQNRITVLDIVNTKTDWEIKEEIKDQLWWSPFVDSDAVSVSVTDEVATLTGIVTSRFEAQAAITNARQGGAAKVINNLKIAGYPDSGLRGSN